MIVYKSTTAISFEKNDSYAALFSSTVRPVLVTYGAHHSGTPGKDTKTAQCVQLNEVVDRSHNEQEFDIDQSQRHESYHYSSLNSSSRYPALKRRLFRWEIADSIPGYHHPTTRHGKSTVGI
ncbi:hypothetical protein WAI453_004341 [Rhynchosporium graminicola]